MLVLALNAGSSSLKVALFAVDAGAEHCLLRGEVERIGRDGGSFAFRDGNGKSLAAGDASCADHVHALRIALDAFDRTALPKPQVIGHRLVHGGAAFGAAVRVDTRVRESLDALVRLAPLHLPRELAVLDAAIARFPTLPEIACFDTAFHRTMPEVAKRLALPRDLFDEGVRRYGFHGLSYEYVVETIGATQLGRAVIAHLGSGASMAAVVDGHSIDTTMGLTPTGGLVMGTRSGDLDPGVLVHLMDAHACGARDLETLLNERSGLRGVSGTTGDMKVLLDASARDPRAAVAVEMFCYVARKFIGALTAALGGMDTLVFTGGIGERSPPIRARICKGLEHLGVALDPALNERGDTCVSASQSPCRVLVVPTDEERMICRHAIRALSTAQS